MTASIPGTSPTTLVAAWRARVAARPDGVAVTYFDGRLTAADLDEESDALAVAFAERGTGRGDRVGLYLQNIPQFVVALLALWKLGATALILNPMYRRAELRRLVDDAAATGFVCRDADLEESLETLAGSSVRWTVTTSDRDYQTRDDPRVLPELTHPTASPANDLRALVSARLGQGPPGLELTGDDIALLTYTSGTTGPPKGAMNTHANLVAVTSTYAAWTGLESGDVVFAMAPLFHITGAVVNATVALLADATLALAGRFHPEVALETFVEQGVTTTIGSITAYNAMAAVPWAGAEHFASVKVLCSGGAPIPPATVERFEERFGHYIHNAYGMTETSSAVIVVPIASRAPVESASGTLAIGMPLPGLTARVVAPDGTPRPPLQQGELELTGPQVVPGYWRRPEDTATTMPGGRLRTGDVAIIDAEGWVYLVDRLKDQINVSGYKVWPREVEDALYEHPDVREVAVVGEPDEYRGESVAAYVSLRAGAVATPESLVAHARKRLAAYKVPRRLEIIDELPKTQTGKIRRNVLRDRGAKP